MATTEELEKEILAEMAADPVAYSAGPVDDVITIDGETRVISVPASEILFGVETDKDVERKHFRCPKIVGDGIDLSKHQIYISYITSDSIGKTFSGDAGLYLCEDVSVDGEDITFSWQLSGNVFASAGFIAFKVLAAKTDGENVQTRWNTVPAVGTVLMTVPDGIDISETYTDIVTQLLERMASVEKIATEEAMQGYVNTYLEVHPAEIDETLTDPKKAAPASVVGELKEDLGEIDNAVFDTTTTEELVNTNPIVEDGKTLYTSTYVAIQEQSNSSIATLTDVVVGETLSISSTVINTATSWGFTFTDDKNKTIYHYFDESLPGLKDETNINITVPEGATKLYVSRLSSKGKPEVFRKKAVKRKAPKSNLIDVLHGKKLVVFGDSMAYGHTIPESVWTKLLAEKHGMILTNFAQNGTTITRKTTTMSGATFLDTDSVHAKVMNNLNNPVEADYIIVFGGTNDIARNDQCPLGTIDDTLSQTFYGALNAICQRLIQTYPKGHICFITPYIRNAGLATAEISKQYVKAIHDVCEKYGGIPVFDNTVNGALDFSNSYQVNALTMKDSYHLNEDGHKRAMHKYEVFLQSI